MKKPMRNVWAEIKHKDDATDEEKKVLLEEMRNSPPISPMHAFLHPSMMVEAHKKLKRYQGKTWVRPRVEWVVLLMMTVLWLWSYISNVPQDATPSEAVFRVLSGLLIAPVLSLLIIHALTTVSTRLGETCVRCHILQRSLGGTPEAVLSLSAYKLPFLDSDRHDRVPWEKKWWQSAAADVTLETNRDIIRLSLADIYDQRVCRVRPPAVIPPTVKRYVIRKVERHGDVIIREKGMRVPRIDSQTLLLVIIGISGVAATVAGLFLNV